MSIKDLFGKELLFFDGGLGTMLQTAGLKGGRSPELWNLEEPGVLLDIHEKFLDAGCNILTSNTFRARDEKYMAAGVRLAREAVEKYNSRTAGDTNRIQGKDKVFVAAELGPSGSLLEPLGELSFEDAYKVFADLVRTGADEGADAIIIETMPDIYDMKAAILAAKENCNLPVIASMTFEQNKKYLTGGDVKTAVAVMEGLGADVIGTNCGFGPAQIKDIVKEFFKYASVPVMANPNAGLPQTINGETVFTMGPKEYALEAVSMAQAGAWLLGGCCGTTPEHIRREIELCKNVVPPAVIKKHETFATSYAQAVQIGFSDKDRTGFIPRNGSGLSPKDRAGAIQGESSDISLGEQLLNRHKKAGEKINPTGNKLVKEALKAGDTAAIKELAAKQQHAGADILDINVGLPEIDEKTLLPHVIKEVQSVVTLPLIIDTSDIEAMEKALRIYNGKAVINSVNGKKDSMEKIFPLVKKYGGVVIGLTLDENGIPKTPKGRLVIAKKIIETAEEYGIDKKDIIIDTLAMTISVDENAGENALAAMEMIKKELGTATVLGVSNISFGLPDRDAVNSAFYKEAVSRGLDMGIIDPFSENMMAAAYGSKDAKGAYKRSLENMQNKTADVSTLKEAIEEGLKEKASALTRELLKNKKPLDIIDSQIVPALNEVGRGFEDGSLFLPQLLMSSDAAQSSFAVLKSAMKSDVQQKKDRVILATVQGDIHDIGKNIVKVLLGNYGYEVMDLGKDVPPEKIAEAAEKENINIIGLSALMTTTAPSMKDTIDLFRDRGLYHKCRFVVGGAVLSESYAKEIGAHFYARDAMATVHYVQKLCDI